jgi:hypothetical protein
MEAKYRRLAMKRGLAKTNFEVMAVFIIVLLFAIGCSSAGTITGAGDANDVPHKAHTAYQHNILGLWQFKADPVAKTLDVTQLRTGSFHLNALPFL